jgi:hypothetical protein
MFYAKQLGDIYLLAEIMQVGMAFLHHKEKWQHNPFA